MTQRSDQNDQNMWTAIEHLTNTVNDTVEKLKPLLELQAIIQKIFRNWKGIATFLIAIITAAYLVGKYESQYKNDPSLSAALKEQSQEIHTLSKEIRAIKDK